MKAYVYIYSRTSEKDYRPLTKISDSRCSNEFLMRAELRAIGLTRASDEQLEQPQWLFMKEGNCAIWGLACMNRLLDSRYSNDKTDTPIRGFTALVIPNYNGEPLPYDVSCFSEPFCKVMKGFFFSFNSSVSNVEVEVPTDGNVIEPSRWNNSLNTDIRYCKIMPCSVDGTALLKEAMAFSDDISIAVNVAKVESVSDKKVSPPMNAVLRDGEDELIVETGLFPPNRVDGFKPFNEDWHINTQPVMYGTPEVLVEPIELGLFKMYTWPKIKIWIRIFLLILSLTAIAVFVCFTMFKSKGEKLGTMQPTPSSTKEKGNNYIEKSRDRNNFLFIFQNGLPEQNRGIHERTDGEFHNSIPESVEGGNTATPTNPVYDPQGNNGDASAEQSPHKQTGVERP